MYIVNISVIGISVYLLIGTPLVYIGHYLDLELFLLPDRLLCGIAYGPDIFQTPYYGPLLHLLAILFYHSLL